MRIIGKHGLVYWLGLAQGLAMTAVMGAVVFDNTGAPNPERLHAEAEKLIRKAQDLKEQGSAEEASKLANQAEKLRREAGKIAKDRAPERERGQMVPREKQENMERLRAKVKELAEAGRMDEASRLKEEMQRMEKPRDREPGPDKFNPARERLERMRGEIAKLRESGRAEEAERLEGQLQRMKEQVAAKNRPMLPGPERARAQERRPGQADVAHASPEEVERRMHHVRVAIENLHAAGLHEPAQRLAQEAEQFHARFREHRMSTPDSPRSRGEGIEALQSEIRELRQAVQQLRQQLEEVRQRR